MAWTFNWNYSDLSEGMIVKHGQSGRVHKLVRVFQYLAGQDYTWGLYDIQNDSVCNFQNAVSILSYLQDNSYEPSEVRK